MRGTTDAQGDAIRTGDSFTNTMLSLREKMAEMRTEIGLKLLPVLTPFVQALADLAEDIAPKVVTAMGNILESIDVETLKTNIDAFVTGLLEGDFVLPNVKVTFKPTSN